MSTAAEKVKGNEKFFVIFDLCAFLWQLRIYLTIATQKKNIVGDLLLFFV